MVHAVICRSSRAEIRVNSKVTRFKICSRQSNNGEDLALSISVLPRHCPPASAPSSFTFIISHRLCIMSVLERDSR
jgi:hypothetical protein